MAKGEESKILKFDTKYYLIGGVIILVAALFVLLSSYKPSAPGQPAQQPNLSQELPKVNPGIAQGLTPGKCPANQCRPWIFGSCSKKQLYKEKECFRYGAFPDCPEETYYDSHTEPVEACDENDCPAGKNFFNYTCV